MFPVHRTALPLQSVAILGAVPSRG